MTAAEEIFINVSSYAYPNGEGEVLISVEPEEDKATISFEDSGIAYNPLEKEDPDITLPADEREIGGLGIYIVKKMMDKMEYTYLDGKNRFTMTKNWQK